MAEKKPFSDPRWWDNPQPVWPKCNRCKHYLDYGKCEAFPNGIPNEIIIGEFDHANPYSGDNGIQFIPK